MEIGPGTNFSIYVYQLRINNIHSFISTLNDRYAISKKIYVAELKKYIPAT